MSQQPMPYITVANITDVDAMEQVEFAAHLMPWSRQHLHSIIQQQGNTCGGYMVRLLQSKSVPHTVLLGYFVVLLGYQELHLLNLAIHPKQQRKGYAYILLQHLRKCAIQCAAHSMWLEVRQSNIRAQHLYRRFGFMDVGIRADYYSTPTGMREAALVMQYIVP